LPFSTLVIRLTMEEIAPKKPKQIFQLEMEIHKL
jgi:hypothetical protein